MSLKVTYEDLELIIFKKFRNERRSSDMTWLADIYGYSLRDFKELLIERGIVKRGGYTGIEFHDYYAGLDSDKIVYACTKHETDYGFEWNHELSFEVMFAIIYDLYMCRILPKFEMEWLYG